MERRSKKRREREKIVVSPVSLVFCKFTPPSCSPSLLPLPPTLLHLSLTFSQMDEPHSSSRPSTLKYRRRSTIITTSNPPCTPPHSHTPHTSHPTPKHSTPPKQPTEKAPSSSTRPTSQGSSLSSPTSPPPSPSKLPNKTRRTGSPSKVERPHTTPLSSPSVSPTKKRGPKEALSPSPHRQKKMRTHAHSPPRGGVQSEKGGSEGGKEDTPQRKVPSVLNGLWSRMSELDRMKRVKILAERVMKVRGP